MDRINGSRREGRKNNVVESVPCSGPGWLIFALLPITLPVVSFLNGAAGGTKPFAACCGIATPDGASPWTAAAAARSSVYSRKQTVTHTAVASTATFSHSDLLLGKPILPPLLDPSFMRPLRSTPSRAAIIVFLVRPRNVVLPQQHPPAPLQPPSGRLSPCDVERSGAPRLVPPFYTIEDAN